MSSVDICCPLRSVGLLVEDLCGLVMSLESLAGSLNNLRSLVNMGGSLTQRRLGSLAHNSDSIMNNVDSYVTILETDAWETVAAPSPLHILLPSLWVFSSFAVYICSPDDLFYAELAASSIKGVLSSSLSFFYFSPNILEISELCILELATCILERSALAQTMKALEGHLTCSFVDTPGNARNASEGDALNSSEGDALNA